MTVGNHPALLVAACLYLARGEDELRVAGALFGEPVELVRCRHVPLEVPAGCELVLEGENTYRPSLVTFGARSTPNPPASAPQLKLQR